MYEQQGRGRITHFASDTGGGISRLASLRGISRVVQIVAWNKLGRSRKSAQTVPRPKLAFRLMQNLASTLKQRFHGVVTPSLQYCGNLFLLYLDLQHQQSCAHGRGRVKLRMEFSNTDGSRGQCSFAEFLRVPQAGTRSLSVLILEKTGVGGALRTRVSRARCRNIAYLPPTL